MNAHRSHRVVNMTRVAIALSLVISLAYVAVRWSIAQPSPPPASAALPPVSTDRLVVNAPAGKPLPHPFDGRSLPKFGDGSSTNPTTQPRFAPTSVRNPFKFSPARSKYAIAPGVYRQAGVSDVRRLVVQADGHGQLVLDFAGIPAVVVGASQVVIETTWKVEGDDVTFTLLSGRPEAAYRRVLGLALEEVTRFHIKEFGQDALTLVRVKDGEVFRWERVVEP